MGNYDWLNLVANSPWVKIWLFAFLQKKSEAKLSRQLSYYSSCLLFGKTFLNKFSKTIIIASINTNFAKNVISSSLKDRSAVLITK
jgi:hypothetical protein